MSIFHFKFLRDHTRGFSAIEMMVAVALFSSVVVLSVGAMVTLVNANEKSRTLKTAMDNLNFVMEEMSRNIRAGTKYFCQTSITNPIVINPKGANKGVQSCVFDGTVTSGGAYLGFRDRDGLITFYRHNGGCIQKKVVPRSWDTTYASPYTDSVNSGYSCLTAPEVYITNMRFYTYITPYNYATNAINSQPYVGILVRGYVGERIRTQSTFDMYTSVTQRIPHFVCDEDLDPDNCKIP